MQLNFSLVKMKGSTLESRGENGRVAGGTALPRDPPRSGRPGQVKFIGHLPRTQRSGRGPWRPALEL